MMQVLKQLFYHLERLQRSKYRIVPPQAVKLDVGFNRVTRKNDAPNSTEPHRGFGYVEFENEDDVKDAIDNMDQAELFGRVIKVNPAKPPKNNNEGLGSKTAVWEQVSHPVE